MNWELLLKIVVSVVMTGVWLIGLRCVWTSHLDPKATVARLTHKAMAPPEWVVTRDPNRIYQGDKIVGDVSGPVQRKDGEVHFAQLSNSSAFDTKEPFQYQRLKLRVVRIGTAIGMKVEMSDTGARTLTAVFEDVLCRIVQ